MKIEDFIKPVRDVIGDSMYDNDPNSETYNEPILDAQEYANQTIINWIGLAVVQAESYLNESRTLSDPLDVLTKDTEITPDITNVAAKNKYILLIASLIKIENIVPQYDETIANPDSSYYLVKAPLSPKTIGAVIKAYRGSSSYTEFSQILNAVGIIFNDQESG